MIILFLANCTNKKFYELFCLVGIKCILLRTCCPSASLLTPCYYVYLFLKTYLALQAVCAHFNAQGYNVCCGGVMSA